MYLRKQRHRPNQAHVGIPEGPGAKTSTVARDSRAPSSHLYHPSASDRGGAESKALYGREPVPAPELPTPDQRIPDGAGHDSQSP